MKKRDNPLQGWWIEIIWHLLIPVLFVSSLVLFFPFRSQMGETDEGLEVIKGLLVNEGYELYKEIWNEQPPLYTYILSTIYHFAGYNFTLSRLSTIFLSGILMWACIQYLRFTWGNLTAVMGALFLFLLPMYNRLSTFAMIGLPAISFAMVSMLFITLWHIRRRKAWLVLSGVFLGLSVLTKIFTGLLGPIFLIGLLAGERSHLKTGRDWRRFLEPAVIWGLSFSVVLVTAILVFVKIENLALLITPHLSALKIEELQLDRFTIWFHVKAVLDIILLALIGLGIGLARKSWLTLYPGAWMLVAFVLLSQHAPVWSHQQLLVTVPAAMLASIAASDSLRFLAFQLRGVKVDWWVILLRAIPVILFMGVFAIRFPQVIQEFDLRPQVGIQETSAGMRILSWMNDYADETHWIVTDLPIFAFRLQKPVPPELAEFSRKRTLTGDLTEADVIEAISEYKPEMVMLGRFEFPSVREYLDLTYILAHHRDEYVLYVRPDLTAGR